MKFLCNYTREEMLTIVAEHAGKTIPQTKDGFLRAKLKEDGSVEIHFIEHDFDAEKKDPSSMN